MKLPTPLIFVTILLAPLAIARSAEDIVFADFEGADYGAWKATGEAFGGGPAKGTLPGQMHVEGYAGKGLVNSFVGGDDPQGTLTSPEFKIEHKFIAFLIGGGGHEHKTCLNLVIDGKTVRTATGPNAAAGGSERLEPSGWDVAELAGKTAKLEIVDAQSGGWGHVNVDQIVLTDKRPPLSIANATRLVKAEKMWLHLPVKTGGPKRKLSVLADGKTLRQFEIELADAQPDWWAALDIAAWQGQTLTLRVDKLPADSLGLAAIEQGNRDDRLEKLYAETLRPQFHFSARRGWINDPNGLVFFGGEYHLFFQHNPYGWSWGNMHWGHAVSRDLVHWEELGEALYPDDMGPMFSGSAVVDWKNTSGLGREGQPPLVLLYTAAGNPTVQGLAYSTDGRTFTKYAKNPILPQITPGNRDPKVIWHEPSRRWVMTLYVEQPPGKHTIEFFTSQNLKEWAFASKIEGFFECPDFFELPVAGDAAKKKWVLTAANSNYMVGRFDGRTFTPESPMLTGHRGRGFYAAQTFSDEPHGRRVQIGWGQMPSPGMAFNQLQTFPCELSLKDTAEGPRLAWQPVEELEKLRAKSWEHAGTLKPSDANPLGDVRGELLEIRTTIVPAEKAIVTLNVRGLPIAYDRAKQELIVMDHRALAPLRDGALDLVVLVDRTSLEVFADGGLVYVPLPAIAKPGETTVGVSVEGGQVAIKSLQVHALQSAWPRGGQSGAP